MKSGSPADRNCHKRAPSVAAMIEIVRGDVRFTLDGDEKELAAGSWTSWERNINHAVYAKTDAVMLLTMLTGVVAK